jgi:hypothetical protein
MSALLTSLVSMVSVSRTLYNEMETARPFNKFYLRYSKLSKFDSLITSPSAELPAKIITLSNEDADITSAACVCAKNLLSLLSHCARQLLDSEQSDFETHDRAQTAIDELKTEFTTLFAAYPSYQLFLVNLNLFTELAKDRHEKQNADTRAAAELQELKQQLALTQATLGTEQQGHKKQIERYNTLVLNHAAFKSSTEKKLLGYRNSDIESHKTIADLEEEIVCIKVELQQELGNFEFMSDDLSHRITTLQDQLTSVITKREQLALRLAGQMVRGLVSRVAAKVAEKKLSLEITELQQQLQESAEARAALTQSHAEEITALNKQLYESTEVRCAITQSYAEQLRQTEIASIEADNAQEKLLQQIAGLQLQLQEYMTIRDSLILSNAEQVQLTDKAGAEITRLKVKALEVHHKQQAAALAAKEKYINEAGNLRQAQRQRLIELNDKMKLLFVEKNNLTAALHALRTQFKSLEIQNSQLTIVNDALVKIVKPVASVTATDIPRNEEKETLPVTNASIASAAVVSSASVASAAVITPASFASASGVTPALIASDAGVTPASIASALVASDAVVTPLKVLGRDEVTANALTPVISGTTLSTSRLSLYAVKKPLVPAVPAATQLHRRRASGSKQS